jgi:TonB family protein
MKRMARTAILSLLALGALMALPVEAQRRACPRIPSVTNDPLNRSYRAGDTVPAELLDPPFAWSQCEGPSVPAGAARGSQPRVVFLSVTVDETGAVIDARPRGAIDPEGYYDAAVAAIRNWRASKPRWRGLPVKASIAVDVSFARAEAPAEAAQATTPSVATETPPPVSPAAVQPAVAPAAEAGAALAPAPATASTPQASQATAALPPTPASVASDGPQMRTETRAVHQPVATSSQMRAAGEPFAVEYYYKVKWGFAEEFWRLFNRNHWPLLRKQMEMGRILEVRAASPRYHATEDGRWDYRVTIVFRSAAEANAPFDTESLERQLFADLEGYRREERRRFELLLAHWDVPVMAATLEP